MTVTFDVTVSGHANAVRAAARLTPATANRRSLTWAALTAVAGRPCESFAPTSSEPVKVTAVAIATGLGCDNAPAASTGRTRYRYVLPRVRPESWKLFPAGVPTVA